MIITAAEIVALRPCAAWGENRIKRVVGRGLTPTRIAQLVDVSAADRRWALTQLAARTDAGRRALVTWAAGCAQDVAHLAADEDAARCAISMAVAWAEGCATVDEVRAAAAYADAAAAAAYSSLAEQHLMGLAAAMEALITAAPQLPEVGAVTCPSCDDLAARLDNQAATNRALIREIDRLRVELVRLGLHEISETSAIDLRPKATITGGV